MKVHRVALCLSALLAAGAAGEKSYETPPVLRASDFLDGAILKGPHYQFEEKVVSDGVFNTYTITSDYGAFKVEGTTLAALRAHEMTAIAKLMEVDKIAVAAGGIAASVVGVGKGVVHVVTNPVGTVKGIGSGVGRLFGRVGRGAARTTEKMGSGEKPSSEPQNLVDRKDAAAPGQSTAGKVVGATGDLAKDIIGVNAAMRSWAKKLRVDPYTRNEVLHNELRDVAQYDAGGRFAPMVVPLGTVAFALGATATADDLIWMKEPDELVTYDETRLKAMGVLPGDSRAFRLNPQYNLSRQVRLVTALDAMPDALGRPEFVARAAGAQVDADAQFYTESALLAEIFNRTQAPVSGIVANMPGACVLAAGNRFACLFPLDYVAWTKGMAGHFENINKRVTADYPKRTRELWLTGKVSPLTGTELAARGWTVHEKGMTLISEIPPEPTPTPAPEKTATPN